MKERKKLTNVLVTLLAIIVVGAMGWFLFNQFQVLRGVHKEIATEEAYIEQVCSYIESLKELGDQSLAIKERLTSVSEVMPASVSEGEIVNYLLKAANSPESKLADIRFKDSTSSSGYVEIPVEVQFEGRYNGVLRMLDNLSGGPQAVRVNEISISQISSGLPEIKATLSLTLFSLKN